MENIEEDTATTGKRNNFQSAVNYLVPKYPVAKRQNNSNNRNEAQLSDVSDQGQGFGFKFGIGNTGAHFRYHTNHEYPDQNYDQNNEIGGCREERKKQVGVFKIKNNNKNGGGPYKNKKAMAAEIENIFQ